jgi:hypothetical protein
MPLEIIKELGKTKEYIQYLENIISEIRPYIYFWVVKLKDDTELIQYNKDGTETLFSVVKEQLNNNNVKSISWISRRGSLYSYTMNVSDNDILVKNTGIYRRGKVSKINNVFYKSWCYVLGKQINGTNFYFIINEKGEGITTSDENKEVGS